MSKLSSIYKLANELGVKEVLKEVIRRLFLPDIVSKLTFVIVGMGASILLFPTPLKVLFYNVVISTFNINAGSPITIAEMSNGIADYWMGLALVVLGVIYNVASRILQFYADHFNRLGKNTIAEVDRQLFDAFLSDLPSDSEALELARSQDFGHTFAASKTYQLDTFLNKWRHPEFVFLDPELESRKVTLYKKAREFNSYLAYHSAPIGINRQGIVPPGTNDFNWPKHVDEEVAEANRLGTEFSELHCDFILTAKRQLIC